MSNRRGSRPARRLGELDVIDDVAAIARQFDAIRLLARCRARLGELSGNPADLYHRLPAGKGQDHRHLQENAEEITDIVGGMLGETFGTVAALEQETLAFRDPGKLALELPCLAGKDKRRKALENRFDGGELCLIVIMRHLLNRQLAPAL